MSHIINASSSAGGGGVGGLSYNALTASLAGKHIRASTGGNLSYQGGLSSSLTGKPVISSTGGGNLAYHALLTSSLAGKPSPYATTTNLRLSAPNSSTVSVGSKDPGIYIKINIYIYILVMRSVWFKTKPTCFENQKIFLVFLFCPRGFTVARQTLLPISSCLLRPRLGY